MMVKTRLIFTLYTVYGILFKAMATKGKARGASGQYPLVQNLTVTEGGTANLTCRVEYNDNTSLQWSNPAQQTLFFGDKKALRDNRIELVHASWSELTISINDVTLSDEGMYTCSLFTMPVRTAKAYLTVLGVPEKPQINGLLNPALEGDHITLTCITQGSKPAADLRWFRNEKEIKGAKEVNASGKTFTVQSSLQLHVDRNDDGVAYTCKVDHVALTAKPQAGHRSTGGPLCSPGRDHPLPCGPSGGPVLEAGVRLQREPFVSPSHSRSAGVSLLCRAADSYTQQTLFHLSCPGRPDPVIWTKDGGELPDLDRMIVEGRELTFTSLNKTDNGTYRCEASNLLGTNSAEYVLFVYDPNAVGQHGTDHALIGGVVAVVVFVTLCLIIVLGRYLARHKGTYLTNEAKGADDAPDADTAIIKRRGQPRAQQKRRKNTSFRLQRELVRSPPPPLQSLYLRRPSSLFFPPFFLRTTPTPPPSCRRGTCRRSTERFPKCLPIIATFIICISSFSLLGGPAFMGSVAGAAGALLSHWCSRPQVCISASYITPTPASQRHTVPTPHQHISYLLSTRCLKIQPPLNFCQCLHVLSVGRAVKPLRRRPE
uniref:Cell adhesion molecule 2a n=1 Tax=Takifugu rubripes TaxID=31033 RepID=A0A674NF78_TAKRU